MGEFHLGGAKVLGAKMVRESARDLEVPGSSPATVIFHFCEEHEEDDEEDEDNEYDEEAEQYK